jgi:hypothetical protein
MASLTVQKLAVLPACARRETVQVALVGLMEMRDGARMRAVLG